MICHFIHSCKKSNTATKITLFLSLFNSGSGERLGVAVTLMLAVTVFMLLVAESIPESSDSVPFIGVFFLFCMSCMFCIIVGLCVVSNLYHRTKVRRGRS